MLFGGNNNKRFPQESRSDTGRIFHRLTAEDDEHLKKAIAACYFNSFKDTFFSE